MQPKFVDIGVNLTDSMYQGEYHGSKKHEPDLDRVLERAWTSGMEQMIITGGNLADATTAIELADSDDRLFATVGCHPTRCTEFEENPEEYLFKLKNLIVSHPGKVVALGEFGLDYDRLNICPKETQIKYFELQLTLAESVRLPLFLHCRNAASDLYDILKKHKDQIKAGGVVHSFDGTLEEAQKFIDLGYFIGLNGCSLKTSENLEVVKDIPIDKILLETDAPWCEIKNTHAGKQFVKTNFDSVKKRKVEKRCSCQRSQ